MKMGKNEPMTEVKYTRKDGTEIKQNDPEWARLAGLMSMSSTQVDKDTTVTERNMAIGTAGQPSQKASAPGPAAEPQITPTLPMTKEQDEAFWMDRYAEAIIRKSECKWDFTFQKFDSAMLVQFPAFLDWKNALIDMGLTNDKILKG